jgi:hypothetical protein
VGRRRLVRGRAGRCSRAGRVVGGRAGRCSRVGRAVRAARAGRRRLVRDRAGRCSPAGRAGTDALADRRRPVRGRAGRCCPPGCRLVRDRAGRLWPGNRVGTAAPAGRRPVAMCQRRMSEWPACRRGPTRLMTRRCPGIGRRPGETLPPTPRVSRRSDRPPQGCPSRCPWRSPPPTTEMYRCWLMSSGPEAHPHRSAPRPRSPGRPELSARPRRPPGEGARRAHDGTMADQQPRTSVATGRRRTHARGCRRSRRPLLSP